MEPLASFFQRENFKKRRQNYAGREKKKQEKDAIVWCYIQ